MSCCLTSVKCYHCLPVRLLIWSRLIRKPTNPAAQLFKLPQTLSLLHANKTHTFHIMGPQTWWLYFYANTSNADTSQDMGNLWQIYILYEITRISECIVCGVLAGGQDVFYSRRLKFKKLRQTVASIQKSWGACSLTHPVLFGSSSREEQAWSFFPPSVDPPLCLYHRGSLCRSVHAPLLWSDRLACLRVSGSCSISQ